MKHFCSLLYDHISSLRREWTAFDFIASFYVQMVRRKIPGRTVAVGDHKSVLVWRSCFDRQTDLCQHLTADTHKGNVTDPRDSYVQGRGRVILLYGDMAPRLAGKFERCRRF